MTCAACSTASSVTGTSAPNAAGSRSYAVSPRSRAAGSSCAELIAVGAADEGGVARVGEVDRERLVAQHLVLGVLERLAVDGQRRRAGDDLVDAQPGAQQGQRGRRLERRARRVAAAQRAVDARPVGTGVGDGEHVAGARLHDDQRGALALGRRRQRRVGGGLHGRVERQLQRRPRHGRRRRQGPHDLPGLVDDLHLEAGRPAEPLVVAAAAGRTAPPTGRPGPAPRSARRPPPSPGRRCRAGRGRRQRSARAGGCRRAGPRRARAAARGARRRTPPGAGPRPRRSRRGGRRGRARAGPAPRRR